MISPATLSQQRENKEGAFREGAAPSLNPPRKKRWLFLAVALLMFLVWACTRGCKRADELTAVHEKPRDNVDEVKRVRAEVDEKTFAESLIKRAEERVVLEWVHGMEAGFRIDGVLYEFQYGETIAGFTLGRLYEKSADLHDGVSARRYYLGFPQGVNAAQGVRTGSSVGGVGRIATPGSGAKLSGQRVGK